MATPRILIIDDDPVLLEVLREAIELRLQPSRVEGTTSSADALARLTVDSYDVVLCDWRMPSTNGMAFLDEIKMVRPGIPVVLMTGDIRESIKSQAAEKGAFAFLQTIRPRRSYSRHPRRLAAVHAIAKATST